MRNSAGCRQRGKVWDEVFDHLFPLPEADASIQFEESNGRAVALVPVVRIDVRDANDAFIGTRRSFLHRAL